MSFRDAYVQVGQHLDQVPVPEHDALLRRRTHIGSTGNLGLEQLQEQLTTMTSEWSDRKAQLHTAGSSY